jgi:hypothetical protein
MKRRIAIVLAAICASCVVGVPTASATAEYFYYNNWLSPGGAVSGKPVGSLYFVGAYTGLPSGTYCVAPRKNGAYEYRICGAETTGITISFSARYGEGELYDSGPYTRRFTAEQRY